MRDFIKPSRRKAGCVTLVMACVFSAAWVRSLTELDSIFRLNQNDTHIAISSDGTINWERIWPIIKPRPSRWGYRHHEAQGYYDPVEGCNVHWRFSGFGFDFRAFSQSETKAGVPPYVHEFELWQIPYWSIVLPLTLLSAYLLLVRPRVTKPKSEST